MALIALKKSKFGRVVLTRELEELGIRAAGRSRWQGEDERRQRLAGWRWQGMETKSQRRKGKRSLNLFFCGRG